jgi:pyrimidine 5'-nucleotidase
MRYSTLFFDMDDTLYPNSSGLWDEIRARMETYMHRQMGIPTQQVPELRQRFYTQYGTTLRGLQAEMDVETDDFLRFVHNVPVDEYLSPEPDLSSLLKSLPADRWVFTNSDLDHARRVLQALSLFDCFSGIIDIRAMEFNAKPDPAAFECAQRISSASAPGACVIFEDSPRNLKAAKDAGWTGVYVGPSRPDNGFADLSIEHWAELSKTFPGLWSP